MAGFNPTGDTYWSENMEYVAYSDESGTGERFTSIASFSLRQDALPVVNSTLRQLLANSSVGEFKWLKLKDAKYRHCALKFLEAVWDCLGTAEARVDVLIWDNEDARHAIPGRDDTANFGRMFFHLQAASMKRRPRKSEWRLLPDEKVEIDWDTVRKCLAAIGRRRQFTEAPLLGDFFADPSYSIIECRQVQSHEEPCIQVADLFAGIAVFSRTHYDKYEQWAESLVPNLGLWKNIPVDISNREENRFRVLEAFNSACKKRRLGVSLRTRRCLHTPRPSNPLNFWHYEPQHELDRAPRRGGQKSAGAYGIPPVAQP